VPPQLSNLAICYQAVQRVYRNALIALIRKRLSAVYPSDYERRVRDTFKNEWEVISSSAQERRVTGEITNSLVDDLDVLGVNHFYNLFESHYTVFFPQEDLQQRQSKTNRQTLLSWAKAVKNMRDPLSHPSEADFSFEDSFAILDPARRVLLRFGLEEQAAEVKLWMDELSGLSVKIESVAVPLEDRLPPKETIIVDFVGREFQLEALQVWFDDPTTRRWALAGEGGKGKSAIAYRFATKIKFSAPDPYQIVLWISAKRRRFDDGVVLDITTPDFSDLESALSHILSSYGWADYLDKPLMERKLKVLELLNSFPALLVVDDADSLEGQSEDAVEFFTFDVPQTRTKVLLTSRRVLFGMGNTTTHVSGLQGQDAQDFISSRCRLTELDINLVRPHITEMLKITEGSPLYLEDLLRLCSVMPIANAVTAWRDRAGDNARQYALGRELEILTPRAKHVLLAACMPSKPVSNVEIEAMTALSTEEVSASLKELQKIFLVPKPALYEGEERYNVNLNTRLLVRKALGDLDSYRRIQEAYKTLTTSSDGSESDPVVANAIRRATVLVRAREQAKAEICLQNALSVKPNNANLLGFLGWVFKAWSPRRVTDARETFARAAQLGSKSEDMYRHWCEMEIEQTEWAKAAEAAEKGIQLGCETQRIYYLAGYSRQRLGRELAAGRHTEKAKVELNASRRWLRLSLRTALSRGSALRPTSELFRALVLSAEALDNSEEMGQYFTLWFTDYPDSMDGRSEWTRLVSRFGLGEIQLPY
jgi:tetratricopeptide (TPR) repeat protein